MARRLGSVALLAILGGLAVLAPACVIRSLAETGPLIEREFAAPAGDAAGADLHVDFHGGRVTVASEDGDRIVALVARDNLEEVEPRCDVRRDGRHVSARLWVDTERGVLHAGKDGEAIHEWTVTLGRRVPIDLDLAFAACEAEVDLGGVPLRRARVSLAAGAATVRFSRPAPRVLEALAIELGAGEFTVSGLGNARCRSITIDAGVGEFEIDCHGEWSESALLRIEAGFAAIDVRVPRELPVRVDARPTVFGSVIAPDFHGAGEGRFVSPNWSEAGPHLSIEVEARFGEVTIVRD